MTSQLAIPLFFALTIFSEKTSQTVLKRSAFNVIAIILLIVYGCILPGDDLSFNQSDVLRHLVLTAGMHFAVAWLPYSAPGQDNGYWQYNKILFLRFMLALFFSIVLYLGISLALSITDDLFNITIENIVYERCFVIIGGLFNTIFFLAGIPQDYAALDAEHTYPRGLQIFAQFVLLPLTSIYLAILYVYCGKIFLDRTWPDGFVGWLVSIFSSVGILTFLLLHPFQQTSENSWIKRSTNIFYIVIMPLCLLLAASIYIRVSQYGITEPRYFLIILNLWLFVTTILMLLLRDRPLKWLPFSLMLLAFLSSFGPWSAFNISYQSQLKRLTQIFSNLNILKNGQLQKADSRGSRQDEIEASALIDYFLSAHGLQKLGREFGAVWEDSQESVMNSLGLKYIQSWDRDLNFERYSFNVQYNANRYFNISGYDRLYTVGLYPASESPYALSESNLQLKMDWEQKILSLMKDQVTLATWDLDPIKLDDKALDENKPLILEVNWAGGKASLVIDSFSGSPRANDDSIYLDYLNGSLLIQNTF